MVKNITERYIALWWNVDMERPEQKFIVWPEIFAEEITQRGEKSYTNTVYKMINLPKKVVESFYELLTTDV